LNKKGRNKMKNIEDVINKLWKKDKLFTVEFLYEGHYVYNVVDPTGRSYQTKYGIIPLPSKTSGSLVDEIKYVDITAIYKLNIIHHSKNDT
jgi:hypothetical protein